MNGSDMQWHKASVTPLIKQITTSIIINVSSAVLAWVSCLHHLLFKFLSISDQLKLVPLIHEEQIHHALGS